MAKARVIIEGQDNLKTPLKQAQSDLTGFEKVASGIGDKLKTAFTFTAIIASAKALTAAVSECVNAFKLQNEADARLSATLKSTGQQYIANTAEIKEYASALQSVTRFGDDVIESTAAMLLATKKFDREGLERTIELSADLAEAMGTDLTSAAQTLEKALVDPGEGLTRLRTIGITFTESEKDLIEELKKSNREFEAQQIILDKVEASYGGMAKAIGSVDTSVLDKIKNVWGDLKEDLGTLFLNTLTPVFEWIYNTLKWLERLLNQVVEARNFGNYLTQQDSASLADKFTPEYLQREYDKRQGDYWKQVDSIYDEFHNTITNLETAYELNFYDFVKMSRQQQKEILDEYFNNDYSRYAGLYTELGFLSEMNTIERAIQIQQQDKLEIELKQAQAAEEAAKAEEEAAARAEAVAERWAKMHKVMEATDFLNSLGGSSFRSTPAEPSTFLQHVFATREATEWLSRLGTRYRAQEAVAVQGISTGIRFGITPPSFALPDNTIGATDNLSLGVIQNGGNLGIDSAKGREQAAAGNAALFAEVSENMGKAGKMAMQFASDVQTMGVEAAVLMAAVRPFLEGLGEVAAPMLDKLVDSLLTPLVELGKAVGELILPALQILAPILDMICKATLVVSGTFQYVGQVLQHWVAMLMNWLAGLNIFGWQPFAGLAMTDPGSPGSYIDFMTNKLGAYDTTNSVSSQNARSSASYMGAMSVTINIYQQSPVVGDGGMRDFARMIRREFDELNYYGVTA